MNSTRQQIIAMLKNQKTLSAQEISRALNLTPANIRHHLSILKDEGVVEITGQRKPHGRGRPVQEFTLSRQVRSHNLNGLSHALLEEFVQNCPSDSLNKVLFRIASRLSQPSIPPNPSFTKRLYLAMQRLNEMQYQARWEAHASAPRIYLEHCPYAALIPNHPELCQMDAQLLSILINHPVTQTLKLEKDDLGMQYCLFTAI